MFDNNEYSNSIAIWSSTDEYLNRRDRDNDCGVKRITIVHKYPLIMERVAFDNINFELRLNQKMFPIILIIIQPDTWDTLMDPNHGGNKKEEILHIPNAVIILTSWIP